MYQLSSYAFLGLYRPTDSLCNLGYPNWFPQGPLAYLVLRRRDFAAYKIEFFLHDYYSLEKKATFLHMSKCFQDVCLPPKKICIKRTSWWACRPFFPFLLQLGLSLHSKKRSSTKCDEENIFTTIVEKSTKLSHFIIWQEMRHLEGHFSMYHTLGQKPSFYPEIPLILIFQKCEFWENWYFRNVNFVKNEISKMWIL